MKKSFIVHLDSLDVLDELGSTDEERYINAGKLLFAFRDYHTEKPVNLEQMLKIAFLPFKNQFKRDLEKYENRVNANRENGKKGGRPPKSKKPPVKNEIPTFEEFQNYALEKSPNTNKFKLRLKYDSWVENNWNDGKGKQIKNWKTKLLNTLPYLTNESNKPNKQAGTYSRSKAVDKK